MEAMSGERGIPRSNKRIWWLDTRSGCMGLRPATEDRRRLFQHSWRKLRDFSLCHHGGRWSGNDELDDHSAIRFHRKPILIQRYLSIYHSMQIDRPTANPSTPAVSMGLGQSLLSLQIQVHPRITVDLTDTYFRDVPTYDPTLVGTGLLDAYLYQGINGGARVEFPFHIAGYFSLGQSKDSTDPKNSLNKMFGATVSNIWRTGLEVDARYSKFDSVFASGTYTTLTVSRDVLERFRLNLQAGRYAYSSTAAANSGSDFGNLVLDTNLGSRLFVESMFTAQRGGSLNYNQWTNTVGLRFNNRASTRRMVDANHP